MDNGSLIIACRCCDETAARGFGCTLAHMDYAIKNGRLFRECEPCSKGLLVLHVDSGAAVPDDARFFARQLAGECSKFGFRGVIADIEGECSPKYAAFLRQVSAELLRYDLSFTVPMEYAASVPEGCFIKIPGAVSGGSFCELLDECVKKWGAGRLIMELEVSCERFALPCTCSERISRRELDELNGAYLPMSFFSHDLQTNYFTYVDGGKRLNCVFYDDLGSLRSRMRQAELRGIRRFIALYPEIQPWLRDIIRKNKA